MSMFEPAVLGGATSAAASTPAALVYVGERDERRDARDVREAARDARDALCRVEPGRRCVLPLLLLLLAAARRRSTHTAKSSAPHSSSSGAATATATATSVALLTSPDGVHASTSRPAAPSLPLGADDGSSTADDGSSTGGGSTTGGSGGGGGGTTRSSQWPPRAASVGVVAHGAYGSSVMPLTSATSAANARDASS
mmetsp:Transcript_24687/g.60055  ORF Transcript_24687/g.60055 Transcript_24687/m.60055 type:complete len:197 (-) Transcript_24687:716-1306(-)